MTMFKFKFQLYNNREQQWSLQWIRVAFTVLCGVLLITPRPGIRRHDDTENNHPKRSTSLTSAIACIPDDQTSKSINYQRSTFTTIADDQTIANIPDDQTSANIHDDQTIKRSVDDQISYSIHNDQTSTGIYDDKTSTTIIDDQTSTSIHDDQTSTSIHDDQTSSIIHDDQTSTRIIDDQTSTCILANHTYVNTTHIATQVSTPLIPAHPRHPYVQPFPYPRTRCLHQQNMDGREIGFVKYKNRVEPFRARVTPVTNITKSRGISNHPIRCLHLRNVDEREMAYVNMRNRTTFYQPRPTYMAYEPSEVPLYMRNSVMVKPMHQKNAPIRCLHMKNM